MIAIDRDLRVTGALALVCAAVVVSVPITAVRAIFAVPLCLVLPGYAITAAAFVEPRARGVQAMMLTLALSIATLVLGSLIVNFAPGGIRIASWTALLVLVVVAAVATAFVRRGPAVAPPRRRRLMRFRPYEVILLLFAIVVASAALVLSRVPLPARNAIGFTQLSALSVGTPQAPVLHIAVASAEQHVTSYRLLLVNGSGRPTIVVPKLTLRPGGRYTVTAVLPPSTTGVPEIVTVRLYRVGVAVPYRHVTALIPPAPGSAANSGASGSTHSGASGSTHSHAGPGSRARRSAARHAGVHRRRG
jgi:hypothetical protein